MFAESCLALHTPPHFVAVVRKSFSKGEKASQVHSVLVSANELGQSHRRQAELLIRGIAASPFVGNEQVAPIRTCRRNGGTRAVIAQADVDVESLATTIRQVDAYGAGMQSAESLDPPGSDLRADGERSQQTGCRDQSRRRLVALLPVDRTPGRWSGTSFE